MQYTKLYAVLMTSVIIVGIFNLFPVIASLFNNVTIKSSGTIISISPLHVEGRYIKNSFNQTVILRGVNQEGMLEHPNGLWNPLGGGIYDGYGVWDPNAVKYNIDKMKEWGCNVLRLHTSIRWWVENAENYRQHIRDIIAWAGERGIYVVFEPFSVEGADQYALPYGNYIPQSQRAIMPDKQTFINYWISVANTLKDLSNVIFEIYNEPCFTNVEHFPVPSPQEYFSLVQDWINAVRATEANQLLFVQYGGSIAVHVSSFQEKTYYWKDGLEWVEEHPLYDPLDNIVYSFHAYDDIVLKDTLGGYTFTEVYEELKIGMEILEIPYVLNNLNKPVICGEIGANMWYEGEDLEKELTWFNNCLTIFNEWGVNYIAWVWDVPAHLPHGLLQNDYPWLPPPGRNGEILITKIAQGKESAP
jgi:hypothetical protein